MQKPDDSFELLETLLFNSASAEYLYEEQHLDRLLRSAEEFRWKLPDTFKSQLKQALAEKTKDPLWAGSSQRVRLLISAHGDIRIEAFPFTPSHPHDLLTAQSLAEPQGSLPVVVVETDPRYRVDSSSPFLRNKTTNRRIYDEARARHGVGQTGKPFDVLLVNQEGYVTECTISNLMVEEGVRGPPGSPRQWVTPALSDGGGHLGDLFYGSSKDKTPIAALSSLSGGFSATAGLLPGILRGELLREGVVTERSISLDHLRKLVQRGGRVYCFNSVRGIYGVMVTFAQ